MAISWFSLLQMHWRITAQALKMGKDQVLHTSMVLEVVGQAEVEGHVGGQNGADDQLPDFLCTIQAG